MRKHILLASFAALCATVSTAGAMPIAPSPVAELVKPVKFGFRHHHGFFRHRPYFYNPYYYNYYGFYGYPRWHRHWYF
jgi:hypothetical protein